MNSLFTEAAKLFDDIERYAGPIAKRFENNDQSAAREELTQALCCILTVSLAHQLGSGGGDVEVSPAVSETFEGVVAGALAAAILHVALGVKNVVDGKTEPDGSSAARWATMVGQHIRLRLRWIKSGHAENVPVDGAPGNLGIPAFDFREHLRGRHEL